MKDQEWWFPIVGSVSYRGYFEEASARRYASNLVARGLDVSIGGVSAYSTLGWFADPVLNTFLFYPEDELADLIFHELTHRLLYVSGDTDFNEAFATFVAHEGLRRWFLKHPDPCAEAKWKLKQARWEEFRAEIFASRSRLKLVYEGSAASDVAALRTAKAAEIARLRTQLAELHGKWAGEPDIRGWLHHPINNARLNSVATYYLWVPSFGSLLLDCSDDLPAFYREVGRLGKLSKSDRQVRMEALLGRAKAASAGPKNSS